MTVYHGSSAEVAKPDTVHSRKNVDFGPGFYVTPIRDQAGKWAEKFSRRGKAAVVSRYSLNEAAYDGLKTLTFDSYSEAWLDFVMKCRAEQDDTDYDIVTGGVANDKVFNTLELFFDGLIDKTEAIRRLRYEKPNLQICFRSQAAIDACLCFEGSETL